VETIPDSDTLVGSTSIPKSEAHIHVSVIIVSWNVREYLVECIKSVQRMSAGFPIEIVVVDNASSDGTVECIKKAFPSVLLIANSTNVGFARANNQGLAVARGHYTLFLNPDTLLLNDALKVLAQFLDEHQEAGFVGPRLLGADGETQGACARPFLSFKQAIIETVLPYSMSGLYKPPVVDYETAGSVDAISGAAMMARTAFIRSLGGFGNQFLHCGEDVDLCWRADRSGKHNWYLPSARVFHYLGKSAEQDRTVTATKVLFSTYEYILATHGKGKAFIYKAAVITIQIPLTLVRGLIKCISGEETWKELAMHLRMARRLARWHFPLD